MRTIYKYELKITDKQEIDIPDKFRILSVQLQNDIICVWAIVHTEREQLPTLFHIVGTGHPLSHHWTAKDHIGTVQQGPYVWHVFCRRRE